MAKTVQIERRGHTLVPANPWSMEELESFPEGVTLSVELKTSRSRGELNFYWAGLAVLVDNFNETHTRMWPTARKYHNFMLESLGYTYKLWKKEKDGTYSHTIQVDSVALDNMNDEEFKVLFERVRALTVDLFYYDPWDVWKKMKDDDREKRRDWRQNRY